MAETVFGTEPEDLEPAAARRTLVPTDREVAAGAEFGPRFTPPPQLKEGRPGWGGLFGARDLFAGASVFTIVLFAYFSLVSQLDVQAIGLLLPEISRDLNTSGATLFRALGVIGLLATLMTPVMGYLADRTRRTLLQGVGAVVGHVSIALAGMAGGFWPFVGARALGTAADLVRQPVGLSLMGDYFPPAARARVIAFVGIGGSVGAIAGPAVAGLAGSNFGWRPTLIGFGALAAFFSLGFFLFKEPPRGAVDRLAAGADLETALREQRPIGWTEGWRAAWSVRTVRCFAGATPFITAGAGGAALLMPFFYAERFGLAPFSRGLILSLATIPAILGLAFSGPLTDRLLAYRPGRVLAMLAGVIVLQALGLMAFAFSPFLLVAVALNFLPAFFGALVSPALVTVISLVVPARIRGLGIQTISPFAALGLPIPIILAAYQGTIGAQAALLVVVPFLLVGALFIAAASSGAEQDIRAATAASLAEEALRQARAEGRTKLLICRDVDVTYDGAQVLFSVDFDVEDGELVALLGTNGAGKSSLLRAILGLQQASNGAVFLDGDDVTHLPPADIARRGVVLMPGGRAVFPGLTVEQNLGLAGWTRQDRREVEADRRRVLERFPQLKARWNTHAGDLSGGEQQMLALGQALLMRPRLLLVDELSLGLAAPVVRDLLDMLREINAAGTAIVIVEQSVNVALQVARRAVFMEKGEVRFDGPVEQLVSRPDVVRSVFLAGASTASGLTSAPLASGEAESLLEVSDVRVRFGGVQVLDGVSLRVEPAQVVGIIGPNGAGKSTLFDVIAGFVRPDQGTVTLLGKDLGKLSPDARARAGLARSYQNVHLFPALTVRENIAVALERHLEANPAAQLWSAFARGEERRLRRRVDNLVESLGLEPHADKFLSDLSTGTRRIVDIACQVAARPKLLLLDEPSSGLAQAEAELLGPVIGRIVKETGCGVLLIEHDLGLASSVSHRLIALRQGAVLAEGEPRQVLADQAVMDSILGGSADALITRSIALTGTGGRK